MDSVILGSSIPVFLAILLGLFTSRKPWLYWGLATLAMVAIYPIPHWYVLRGFRQQFFDPLPEDEAAIASVTAHFAWWSIPLCVLSYCLSRWLAKYLERSSTG
ncbi:hypothetical protein [Qipengyuania gaetbuli]|uniref:hypothetical protein n=1 Tax=Qipengyuania gaetbuli TaxID=266952 RepID=UPI001CFE5A39|nr:hypothetical protein [Qipengyuania gaetbuli]